MAVSDKPCISIYLYHEDVVVTLRLMLTISLLRKFHPPETAAHQLTN